MTRSDLTAKLALRMNVSKKDADNYLTCILNAIIHTLEKDGRVVVQGFGSFMVREYEAREAKRPVTGEIIQLPVRRKPVFHVGKELKEMVNGNSTWPASRKPKIVRPMKKAPIPAKIYDTVHGVLNQVPMAK